MVEILGQILMALLEPFLNGLLELALYGACAVLVEIRNAWKRVP